MKERKLTALLALGALLLFYVMFISDGISPATRAAHPTSVERGPEGYYALAQWLRRSGIRSVSLRERYGKLTDANSGLGGPGNLLVVTLPTQLIWRTEELAALDRWLRAGNTLLVMAALCDQPEWGYHGGAADVGSLLDLTGMEIESVAQREQRLHPRSAIQQARAAQKRTPNAFAMLATPLRLEAVAAAPHPLFEGVKSLVAFSDYPRASWSVRQPYDGFVLQLARDRSTGEGVLWTRLLGSGRIWVSGYGSMLTNRAIASGDNARWMANLVGRSLAPGGQVIFDDLHQGISTAYDGRKFYADRRLWVSIAVLLLLWLAWVLGATTLRTPRHGVAAPRTAELLRAGGAVLSRRLTSQAAALRMIGLVLPPRRMQDAEARVAATDLAELQALQGRARAGQRLSLVELHNLLLRIDGQLR